MNVCMAYEGVDRIHISQYWLRILYENVPTDSLEDWEPLDWLSDC
jgi:hypothetical protein